MEEDGYEFVARGPSTRAVRLRGQDYLVSFTREALVGAADQVKSGYVAMAVDHMSYLPPVGHWDRAEVEDDDDGHSQLVMYGRRLGTSAAADTVLPDGPGEGWPACDSVAGAEIGLEPRNFDPDAWESLCAEAPLPVREHAAWSQLPPIIWLLSIPVTWGTAQFMSNFLKKLGDEAAEGLVNWIRTHARRARENSRDSLVEVSFEIRRNLTVSGFIPLDANARTSVDELRQGLEGLGPLASFAGWMSGEKHRGEIRRVAFFYQDGGWNLCWWATPETVHVTRWFRRNCPDPRRFLGRSLLGLSDEQAESPADGIIPPEGDESSDDSSRRSPDG